jgi:polysaccharide export outer membrane protein
MPMHLNSPGLLVLPFLIATGGMAVAPAAAQVTQPANSTTSGRNQPTNDLGAITDGYNLRPGDVLQVSVWKETDLQAEVLIRPDGGMTFPLAGELEAAGHTVAELTSMLESRIRKYIPDAVVTVTVKTIAGNRIFVIGKVNRPGDFPLMGPLDVMQALTLAGGATAFADLNAIRVLRRDGDHQISIKFRYSEVASGHRLDQNIVLKNGDTVVVP